MEQTGRPRTRRDVLGMGAAASVALLAACGGQASTTKVVDTAAPGKVEFWYGLNGDGVQPFMDDFKRDFPQIQLNFTVTSDHANKLFTAALAGSAPSVSTGWPGMLWTIEPAVQMLDDVIKGDKDLKRDNYWPGSCRPPVDRKRTPAAASPMAAGRSTTGTT